MPERMMAKNPRFNSGLRVKSLIMLAMMMLIGAVIVISTTYLTSYNLAEKRQFTLAEERVDQYGVTVEDMLGQIIADLLTVKDTPPPSGIVRAIDNNGTDPEHGLTVDFWRTRLEQIITSLMRHHPEYLQIRYIDSRGNEIVRVDSRYGNIKSADIKDLQNKTDRYYFSETMALAEGKLFFSDFDLNRERGEIIRPFLPVFRIATPIYAGYKHAQGMLIINISGKVIFNVIEKHQPEMDISSDLIVNQNGYYLRHPDPSNEFGFEFDKSPKFGHDEPWIASKLQESKLAVRYDEEHHHVEAFRKIQFDPKDESRYWLYVHYVPEEAAFSDIRHTLMTMLIIITVVMVTIIIMIMIIISKWIINPVTILTKAATELGRGKLSTRVDETTVKGEMQTLYRTVNLFAEEQQLSTNYFEDELERRTSALRRSKDSLNRAQQIAHIGNWRWDIESGDLEWSDEVYRIFGLDKQQVKPTYELFKQSIHPDDRAKVVHAIEQTLEGIAPFHIEHRVVRPSGSERYVNAAGEVIHDTEGKPSHIIGIIHDITERKQVEVMQKAFVATVSHELRTPLTSILGTLELVIGGAVGDVPEKMRELLEVANKNSERLILLINDILDFEKISSGKMTYHFQPQKFMPLIYQSIATNRGYGDQYGVSFVIGKTLDDAEANIDESRLLQVMSNLLSNAAKFSDDCDTVEVDVERYGENIRVSICDHGSGIPENYQEKVFERFSQADSSDTRQKGGTGLGLNITKAIIEAHGGKIDFVTTPGEGATFYFDIPEYIDIEGAHNPV